MTSTLGGLRPRLDMVRERSESPAAEARGEEGGILEKIPSSAGLWSNGWCPDKKREIGTQTQRHSGERTCDNRGRIGETQPEAKDAKDQRHPQSWEGGGGGLPGALEGAGICQHLDDSFWPPELRDSTFLLF